MEQGAWGRGGDGEAGEAAAPPPPEHGGGGGGGARSAALGGVSGSAVCQVIRWDRFLPRRSLRVLLVEQDDSTRHVVTALLRKCSYHVAAVADGLKAWEVMQEKRYGFDLVLTEVAMPSLSGIGLLSQIMATDECKNVPVIMMSSRDSVGIVLKCMLKGAVDFLVKPLRKNELRNLWQHVWRRRCSSSQANASDNSAASNHLSANAGDGSKSGENSKYQSSGSKQEMEIESAQNFGENVMAEAANFPRGVGEKPEEPDGTITVRANVLNVEDGGETRDKSNGNAVEVNRQPLFFAEKNMENKCLNDGICYGDDSRHHLRSREDVISDLNLQHQNDSSKNNVDVIEPMAIRKSSSSRLNLNTGENALCEASTCSEAKTKNESGSSQFLELTLRRPHLNGCVKEDFKEKHVLIHSNASAFSRYSNKRVQSSSPKPYSSSICIRSMEYADKEKSTTLQCKEISPSFQGNAEEAAMHSQLSLATNKEDVGASCSVSLRENARAGHSSNGIDTSLHTPQFGFISLPVPVQAIPYHGLHASYGAILQPILYTESSSQHQNLAVIEKTSVQITSDQSDCHENNLIYHSQCKELHHCEENHLVQHWSQEVDREQVNQSASSSQDIVRGSGSDGSLETAEATTKTVAVMESGNESGVQNCNIKGSDSDRSRREAALIKFRLKRKDRCFEKKVRYHSRKKLAEQRPRVKGQFVRQKFPESLPATEAEE
ncbi:Two-component response regulator-like PRR95 [Ananas comosus]|uniref:Two-component response regulator-like PRR95 n=1 Tax=Ananas comosus TaxID=4615 RepID=A0A199W605_ANACO|nr:Two-component response regulator-like PRR95 [Ananas comosus]